MSIPRHVKRFAWLVIPMSLGAGTLYWVLARSGEHDPKAQSISGDAPSLKSGGARTPEAMALMRGRGLDATRRIVDAYAAWAKDPAALNARELLLASLFKEDDIGKKLSAVLEAVEADPTPPETDPLWPFLTESLSNLWEGEKATKGMDLVLAETRPRARQALISSFSHLATSERLSELTAQQRQTLTETMIDIAPQVEATQKPEVIAALRSLGGNDLADIMMGKGLTGKDGHVLESERAYAKSLEDTRRALEEGRTVD
jgi:hypothetical protein